MSVGRPHSWLSVGINDLLARLCRRRRRLGSRATTGRRRRLRVRLGVIERFNTVRLSSHEVIAGLGKGGVPKLPLGFSDLPELWHLLALDAAMVIVPPSAVGRRIRIIG